MPEIPFAAAIAVSVPAIRLLLAITPSFVADAPVLRREKHAFQAVLASAVVVLYGWSVNGDAVLLAAASLNLGSAVCMYVKAWMDTTEEIRSQSKTMEILLKDDDHD